MKAKKIIMAAVMATMCLSASAQHYRNSRYYNPNSGRLDYSQPTRSYGHAGSHYMSNPYTYFGLRLGVTATDLNEVDYDSSDMKAGVNAGFVVGTALSRYIPLYFETGLSFTQKGGDYSDDKVRLDYIEMPLTVKYAFSPARNLTIEPYVGGYLACGVSGKVTERGFSDRDHTGYNAFGHDGDYDRFDGGLKIGAGISYDVLYAELAYEYGLTNISKDKYYDTHNSALMFNVGLNF